MRRLVLIGAVAALVAAAVVVVNALVGGTSRPRPVSAPVVFRVLATGTKLKITGPGKVGTASAPTVGETLTVTTGGWTNSPTSFSYQWEDCDTAGNNCTGIQGATSASYLVAPSDVGDTIRVVVVASNSAGPGPAATSAATGVVTAGAGTVTFEQSWESSPFTKPGTPGSLYSGIQAGNWSGQSNGALHYFGDLYVDNGTSTPLTTAGSIFNTAGFANIPPGDGSNSARIVDPVPPSGDCPGCPTGQSYTLEATTANGPSTANPSSESPDMYYGLMYYLPAGDDIQSTQIFGMTMWEFHFNGIAGAPIGWALHTNGGSDVNGTGNGIVLALNTGACNPVTNHTTGANTGCQYRSNADHAQCNLPPDPVIGAITCLPGYFAVPAGAVQYGVWNEVVMHVHWAADTTGAIQTWYKTKSSSTWLPGANVTGIPTVQWCATGTVTCPGGSGDIWPIPCPTGATCGYPNHEALETYGGLQTAPWQINYDDQVIGTSLAAVENALPTSGSTATPPANTALPAITGAAQQGQLLTASTGTWTGSPSPTFTYRWRDCDTAGNNCSDIVGATASTYTLLSPDVGHTVRVVVTGSNTAGSASATSTATAVVTSITTANIGTGPSLAECRTGGVASGTLTSCSPGTSGTAGYTNPTAISAPSINGVFPGCGTTTSTTCHIYINVPTNLVVNNPAKPAPLVINFPDGCTGGDSATPKVASCFDGTGTLAAYTWGKECAIAKCISVAMFPNLPGGYYTPYIYGNTTADQGVEVHAIIAYMEAHYAIDPNMIFTAGGSKGGSMAYDMMCDPTFHGASGDHIAGSSAGSTSFPTSSTSFSQQNLGVHAGGCPALLAGATAAEPDPPSTTHPFMMQMWYAPRDQGNAVCSPVNGLDGVPTSVNNCRNGGGLGGAYIQDGLQVGGYVGAPYDGCTPTTPVGTQVPVTSTEHWTGSTWASGASTSTVNARTWTGCDTAPFSYSTTGGSTTGAVQSIDFLAAACHEYACNNVDGLPLFADLSWQFWTTGSSTP